MSEFDIKRYLIRYLHERFSAPVIASEVPFAYRSRRCDLMAIFDEHLIGFEIKSDRDNFTKLSDQLDDYAKTFDKSYLVTTENMLSKNAALKENIGLIVVNNEGLIEERVPARLSSSIRMEYRLDMLTSNKLKKTFAACKPGESKAESIHAIMKQDAGGQLRTQLTRAMHENYYIISQMFYEETGDITNLTEDDLSILEMRSSSIHF